MTKSRIDIIGMNGNDGEVYDEVVCKHCGIYLKVPDTWWRSWARNNAKVCIDCGKAQNKRNDSPEKARERKLRRTYGITSIEYEQMLEEQGRVCYICGTDEPGGPPQTSNFCVDHCHNNGHVRRLLCNDCNSGLGMFKDDPNLLRIAAEYLDDHKN